MATERPLKEIELEETIEHSLITQGGYQKGESKDFDRVKALKIQTLIDFVKTTQPKEWELYQTLRSKPEESFIKRFDEAVAKMGFCIFCVMASKIKAESLGYVISSLKQS